MTDEQPQRRQVQDDTREQQMALLLNLRRSERRTGSDARDEHDNRYELKTVTTGNVTTGRDVGMAFLARLRGSYLIVARGDNTEYGFTVRDLFFLSPATMEGWIAGIEARLARDHDVVTRAVATCRAAGWSDDAADRLLAIGSRGITLNNPKIRWSYIEQHGLRIGEPASVRLRELVAAHPIAGGPAPVPGSGEELARAAEWARELVDEG